MNAARTPAAPLSRLRRLRCARESESAMTQQSVHEHIEQFITLGDDYIILSCAGSFDAGPA